ncbi:MAG: YebG family protein [Motiliproteus sp.]
MKKFERKTVYIYEINGQEKIKVTSAEEAAHWDGVFSIAEEVDQLLQSSPPDIKLDEVQRTELSLYLAQHKTELVGLLGTDSNNQEDVDSGALTAKKVEKTTTTKAPVETKPSGSVKKQNFVQEFKRPVEPSKDGFSL